MISATLAPFVMMPLILIPVLIISGLIRMRLFSRKLLDEVKLLRLEFGKAAEEIAKLRKELKK